MVVIRLARAGAHKSPFYHLVVADKRKARDGRFIERVGYYNPIAPASENYLSITLERVEYWVNHGAQPSPTVARLIKDFTKYGPRPKPAKKPKVKKVETPAAGAAEENAATE